MLPHRSLCDRQKTRPLRSRYRRYFLPACVADCLLVLVISSVGSISGQRVCPCFGMFIDERSSFHGVGLLLNLHGNLEFRPEGDGLDDCKKQTLKQTGCSVSNAIGRDCSA